MAEPKKIPVTLFFGLAAALCMILFTIGSYKGGPKLFIGDIVFLMYLFPFVLAIVAAVVEKKQCQGYLDFRSALKICFGVIVLALAVQAVFTWTLVHMIDPAFDRALRPAVLEQTETTYRRFGMPEDEIRRNLVALKDTDPFDPGGILLGLARNYIVGFLISLLLAFILKKKNPAVA
jgi:hypothetical protein